jgi:hypothetical protein
MLVVNSGPDQITIIRKNCCTIIVLLNLSAPFHFSMIIDSMAFLVTDVYKTVGAWF